MSRVIRVLAFLPLLLAAYVGYLKWISLRLQTLEGQLTAVPTVPEDVHRAYLKLAEGMFWPTLILALSALALSLMALAAGAAGRFVSIAVLVVAIVGVAVVFLVT